MSINTWSLTRLILASSLLLLTGCQSPKPETQYEAVTSWCFDEGPIYTATDNAPLANAVAVKNGIITYVAHNQIKDGWCQTYAGPDAQRVKLTDHALYPGFTDAHAHLLGIGLRELTLNLEGTTSIANLKNKVQAALVNIGSNETLYGRGWIETHWPEKRFPNRYDLDEIAPDTPVILERADGHALVVNSAALKLAKIDENTEIPFGGDILKNDEGLVSGMLIDKAGQLVADLMPRLTDERKLKAYIKGSEIYAQRGWTNMHSMSVDPADIRLLENLSISGAIDIRIYNSIDAKTASDVLTLSKKLPQTSLITTKAIKLYSDGALGSRGAALHVPYADDLKNDGLMLIKKETIMPILRTALQEGIQVNTHAIGDRANTELLNWYEEAYKEITAEERAVSEPRWRIEHAQILEIEDIERFGNLGVIPSMQPSHAIGDLHFAIARLGPVRLKGGYAWRSLIDSGSIIAGGSDAPVEVGSPLIEFYAATVRKDLNGYNNKNWYPDEKVTPQEALKMFTIWPAYAAFEDNKIGTIEVGKRADFTVFDTDIMTAKPEEILSANAVMTIVDGNLVFSKETAD